MVPFPCNSAELCGEQHFLSSNFLSFMLLFRYDYFLTRKYSRFTKSFKHLLDEVFVIFRIIVVEVGVIS